MNYCTLNCGYFNGVPKEAFKAAEDYLNSIFRYVHYEQDSGKLEVTGAGNVPDEPAKLMEIFDRISKLLGDDGKGRIMLQCELTEICYFRKGMWKLLGIQVPPDPFDDIHYAG